MPQPAFPSSGIHIFTEGCLLSVSLGIDAKTKTKNPYSLSFFTLLSFPLGAETLLLLPTCAAGHSGQLGHSLVSRAAGLALSCPISPGLSEAYGETAQLARTVQAVVCLSVVCPLTN